MCDTNVKPVAVSSAVYEWFSGDGQAQAQTYQK
jgi:hypothetical protein